MFPTAGSSARKPDIGPSMHDMTSVTFAKLIGPSGVLDLPSKELTAVFLSKCSPQTIGLGTSVHRPTGVTIIAILNIIGGIVMLFGGLALVAAGAILPSVPMTDSNLSGVPTWLIGGGAIAIGIILLVLAAVSFVVAHGLLRGKGWSWTVSVVLSFVVIVLNALSLATGNLSGIVSIIISAIILYYLYRPHVKAYFGKAQSSTPPAA